MNLSNPKVLTPRQVRDDGVIERDAQTMIADIDEQPGMRLVWAEQQIAVMHQITIPADADPAALAAAEETALRGLDRRLDAMDYPLRPTAEMTRKAAANGG